MILPFSSFTKGGMGEYVNALRTTPPAFELPSLEFVLTNLFVELENDPLKDIFNQERNWESVFNRALIR